MNMRRVHVLVAILATSMALLGQQQDPYSPQQQEPPDQPGQPVARLSVISGDASVRRGDSGDWVAAILNAPLMAGDSISIAPGGSAEMQLDNANFVRIGGDSEIRISQMENGRNQIQVSKGIVTWRVLRDSNAQSEISTPAVAVRPLRLAAVRAEVSADGSTRIIVRRGEAEVATPRGTEQIREGNMMLVRGNSSEPEYQVVSAPARDGWDNWNDQRDNYLERSQSARYVSPDVYGAEDLDQYGRWDYDPAYGNVWTPAVADTWAPYRNGQWVWEDFYGWTWVDSDPWGWAPFHYGSWYYRTGLGWSWFPGARYGHYWWRPAMVGFFGFGGGGVGVGFGFGNVGWVPLAPFEAFHPWYGRGGRGDGRFGNVNIVHNTNITNIYRNARFGNGATAVPAQDFQRGSFRNQGAVNRAQLEQASLVRGGVPVAPTGNNLRFSERAAATAAVPRGEAGNQRFFSRMPAASGTQRMPFAQQQAAARSSFAGVQPEAPSSGWRRFGEPGAAANSGVQARGFQAGPVPGGNTASNPGWNRFGAPQNAPPQNGGQRPAAAVPQAQYSRPAYGDARPNGGPSGGQGGPRAVQVAPQIVQPRSAPPGGGYRSAPAPSFRSAPPASHGGGGGGGAAAGGGNRGNNNSGGHSGRR
jgi:FecR protein